MEENKNMKNCDNRDKNHIISYFCGFFCDCFVIIYK